MFCFWMFLALLVHSAVGTVHARATYTGTGTGYNYDACACYGTARVRGNACDGSSLALTNFV